MKSPLLALPWLLATTVWAAEAAPAADDPIARNVFPPELVMKHQQEIGLTERQRDGIKTEIQKAQTRFVDLQFQMQSEMEKLLALLRARPIDESRTLAQAESLMRLETETKKTHLGMLVRIKNLLTEEQQETLGRLREGAAP